MRKTGHGLTGFVAVHPKSAPASAHTDMSAEDLALR